MNEQNQEISSTTRQQWSSRLAFYMAAVGSAVGLGNVSRFPALAQKYGGGAFFIPYILALFLIGIPVLFLEIALGQYYQTGDVGVFGSFHKRLRGLGVASVMSGFIVVTFYSMLIAWGVHAFFDSFRDENPWTDPDAGPGDAVGYLINEIIGASTVGEDLRPTRLVGANVGYSLLLWFVVFLCVAFGVKNVGRVAYVTMGLPILIIFIFLLIGLTLDGAGEGIKQYIGIWDVSILREDGEVWSEAVGQIFFSLGITFGIMTAYGSHCPQNEPALLNATVIGIADSLFAFIAGLAAFAMLGHLAHLYGVPVTSLPLESFGLIYDSWPVTLGTLPGGIHWIRLLFIMLFLLGLDSAFAMIEAILTVVSDLFKTNFGRDMKTRIAGVAVLISWGFSLIYATDAGLFFLDVVDNYINFIMIFVGFLETFGCGWIYGIEQQIKHFGLGIVLLYICTNFGAVVIGCALWFGVDDSDDAIWSGFVGLFGAYTVGMLIILAQFWRTRSQNKWNSIGCMVWQLAFGNMEALQKELQPVVGPVPFVWCFLIKHFIPHVLLILFVNLAQSPTEDGAPMFGNYEGYANWPFQAIGIMAFAFVGFLFCVGFVAPQVYAAFDSSAATVVSEDEREDEIGGEKELSETTDDDEVHGTKVSPSEQGGGCNDEGDFSLEIHA